MEKMQPHSTLEVAIHDAPQLFHGTRSYGPIDPNSLQEGNEHNKRTTLQESNEHDKRATRAKKICGFRVATVWLSLALLVVLVIAAIISGVLSSGLLAHKSTTR